MSFFRKRKEAKPEPQPAALAAEMADESPWDASEEGQSGEGRNTVAGEVPAINLAAPLNEQWMDDSSDISSLSEEPEASEMQPEKSDSPDYSKEEELLAAIEAMVKPKASKPLSSSAEPVPDGSDIRPAEKADDYLRSDDPPINRKDSAGWLEELPPLPEDVDLQELRSLILGREIKALERIHHHLTDPHDQAESLSGIITEAILLRTSRDNKLTTVLQPTVEQIVRSSVRNNPTDFADNLFPAIGPAIRRSISESIRGMLQDFSKALETTFSFTGLKWWLEGIRTGRKYSEVVLLKTLEYQVEEIYFVHSDTGATLTHLVRDNVKGQDADQVAAMFTVIQQFVNDSFAEGCLSTIEFGELDILLAQAPQAYLACVVRGQAPTQLRADLQAALELMVMECAEELDSFNGDVAPFKKARRFIENLLVARFKDENRSLPFWAKLLPLAVILAMLGGAAWLGHQYYSTIQLEKKVYEIITADGLKPVQVRSRVFGKWNIICFRDELAVRPEKALAAAGLPADRFDITYIPYVSQDYLIMKQRMDKLLTDKPDQIQVSLDPVDHVISISGVAPIGWVLSAYERLRGLPGVIRVDIVKVHDPENDAIAWVDNRNILNISGQASVAWRAAVSERGGALLGLSGINFDRLAEDKNTQELKELRDRINSTVVLFPLNKDQPVPEDQPKLERAVDDIVTLEKLADSMGLSVSLAIYGHADSVGSAKRNYEISQARTKTLAAMLYARGSMVPVLSYGLGADFAEKSEGGETASPKESPNSRKIELRVNISRKPISNMNAIESSLADTTNY